MRIPRGLLHQHKHPSRDSPGLPCTVLCTGSIVYSVMQRVLSVYIYIISSPALQKELYCKVVNTLCRKESNYIKIFFSNFQLQTLRLSRHNLKL